MGARRGQIQQKGAADSLTLDGLALSRHGGSPPQGGREMHDQVRKLRDDQLREAQGTPGLNRRVAFEALGHWFGHVEAEPETMSGWHHHGDNITIGYVLKGKITLEFGRVAGSRWRPTRASTSRFRGS